MKSLGSFFLLLSILFVGCKEKSEWTKWRGSNGDGISKETAWDASKLDSTNILWRKNIGFGHSAIAVRGNNCYASGWKEEISGKDTLSEALIYCLDVKSGKEIWKYSYPSANRSYPGPRSTPVIDGDFLYGLSWEGKLFCIDAQNGKEKWFTDLTKDSLTEMDNWGYCPSPVIYKNLILLNLNKSGIALDKKTGKVVWKSELDKSTYSSVQLVDYKGKIAGVFMSGKKLNLVDPLTGNVILSHEKKNEKGMNNDAMKTADGKLFTSNELLEFSGDSLKSLWINDLITSTFRTGILLNDFAYQFSNNKNNDNLLCVNVKTGVPAWAVDLSGFGAVMAAGDKLMIITGKGKLIIADAKPDKFNVLNELQIFTFDEKSNNWCWTAPTFQNGKLYVRDSFGNMVCINLSI
jgi:outer membrane protein assembly factor BamB